MENKYDKYKDSGIEWIGEIPEHWEVVDLKYLSDIRGRIGFRGYTASDLVSEGEGAFVIGGKHINQCVLNMESPDYISWEKYYESPEIMVSKGDLVMAQRGTLGKVAIIEYDINEATINPSLVLIKNIKCQGKFLYYYLYSESTLTLISILNTATAVPMISQNQIENMPIPIPLSIEQQSIATYLDQKCGEIDELIALQEEMITKLQSYKQSVITEAVTKGLDKNAPLKDSGIEWIGEIPEHWVCTVFKKFLSEPMQYGANEPAEECNYNDPRYIRITDIKDDGTLRDDTFKSLPFEKAQEYMLTKGDLLFARSGATVGKTFLYKEDYAACFAGYLIKARCNKNDLLPNFVFYYTLSNVYQNWKNSIFIQSTIQNIGADKYSVMPIIVPPLSEQQSIADYLDQKCGEIDELISIKQQKIEKLKDYKKSLIFECVTGKRKVC